jgi:hypothetical protein
MARGRHYYTQSLLSLYEEINKVCFDNKLPSCRSGVSVYFNTGLRSDIRKRIVYGTFRCKIDPYSGTAIAPYRIEMNTIYDSPFADVSRYQQTLIHEMCHFSAALITGKDSGHNSVFKSEFIRAAKLWDDHAIADGEFYQRCLISMSKYENCHEQMKSYKYKVNCPDCGWTKYMKNRTKWITFLSRGIALSHEMNGCVCRSLMEVEVL